MKTIRKMAFFLAGMAIFALAASVSFGSRIVNLSTRGPVDGAPHPFEEPMFVGFVTDGPMDLVIRGTGASLIDFGVTTALANTSPGGSVKASTVFEVYQHSNDPKMPNLNVWTQTPTLGYDPRTGFPVLFDPVFMSQVYASVGLPTPRLLDQESGMVHKTPGGVRSVILRGLGNLPRGTILAELTQVDNLTNPARLTNISTRGFTYDDDPMIVGFVIAPDENGNRPVTVMVRACGPSMVGQGVDRTLVDPTITMYERQFDGSQLSVGTNDNWQGASVGRAGNVLRLRSPTKEDEKVCGAYPLAEGSKDAAFVATLRPGIYTAIVYGKTAAFRGTGASTQALVEVYEMPAEAWSEIVE